MTALAAGPLWQLPLPLSSQRPPSGRLDLRVDLSAGLHHVRADVEDVMIVVRVTLGNVEHGVVSQPPRHHGHRARPWDLLVVAAHLVHAPTPRQAPTNPRLPR